MELTCEEKLSDHFDWPTKCTWLFKT